MPITLVSGLPGHGKTLWVLSKYRDETYSGRPVYFSGISDLRLPWIEWSPEKWAELPPGALFVIDEAWKPFPVRPRGEPPGWIGDLAVHRHKGIDFVLIVQHPSLIDVFVRRLVDRHFHVVRKFGTHWATIHEFPTGVRENVDKSRSGSVRHEWRYPKASMELYKSAEVHTVKRRIPARLLLLVFAVFAFVFGSIWGFYRLSGKSEPAPAAAASAPGASAPGGRVRSPAAPASRPGGAVDAVGYVAAHEPRVPGLAFTAPVYDQVTRPAVAPYPAACLSMKGVCRCYSQQATALDVPAELCERIVAGGWFVAWRDRQAGDRQAGDRPDASARAEPPGAVATAAVRLGGGGYGMADPSWRPSGGAGGSGGQSSPPGRAPVR